MTKEKGSTNHSEPSESINPKFTAEAVCDLANKNSKEELQTTTVRELCRKIAELEAKVNVQQMANSVRLEKLEGRK